MITWKLWKHVVMWWCGIKFAVQEVFCWWYSKKKAQEIRIESELFFGLIELCWNVSRTYWWVSIFHAKVKPPGNLLHKRSTANWISYSFMNVITPFSVITLKKKKKIPVFRWISCSFIISTFIAQSGNSFKIWHFKFCCHYSNSR